MSSKTKKKDQMPDFIKEFLKTEGIDLEEMVKQLPSGEAGSTQTRIKLLMGSMELIEAMKTYNAQIFEAGKAMNFAVMNVLALMHEVHTELIAGDSAIVSDEDAEKVAKAMEKLNDIMDNDLKN